MRTALIRSIPIFLLISLLTGAAFAAEQPAAQRFIYQPAPKAIHDALASSPVPQVSISPTRQHLLVIESLRQPPISDLAAPMLRIAGLRINPASNGLHHPPHHIGLRLVSVADGPDQKEQKV